MYTKSKMYNTKEKKEKTVTQTSKANIYLLIDWLKATFFVVFQVESLQLVPSYMRGSSIELF